ncbi:hypothetical protein [Chroococcidiopsis sp. SAG 2025]|nr:hypothetical protein [Chroococcidiopsis sp. SAG 2025]
MFRQAATATTIYSEAIVRSLSSCVAIAHLFLRKTLYPNIS